MKKFELFPTPVMEFDFTNHPDIPKLLDSIDYICKKTSSNIDNHTLVKKGYSSYNKFNILFFPELIDLKNDIQKTIDHYSRDLSIIFSHISQSWFNILDTEGKVDTHHHGSSVISGAFYPLLEKDTCNLCFKSPLYVSKTFESSKPINNNHFQDDVVMPIKQNHLYLFPGWLEHYTEENKGNKRIVLSFNTNSLKYI